MNKNPLYRIAARGLRTVLLMAIFALNFGATGTNTARAIDTNDNFINATGFTDAQIPYTDIIDTTEYSNDAEAGELPVPVACDGKMLELGKKTAWYKYTASKNQLVSFDTFDSLGGDPPELYDTYIAVWTGDEFETGPANLTFVACDDDNYDVYTSQVAINVTSGTTYYIQVAEYASSTPTGGTVKFSANFKNTDISIGGSPYGNYYIPGGKVEIKTYTNTNNGPLLVTGATSAHMVSSMRMFRRVSGKNVSYSEAMGIPADQVADDYYFPWYTSNSGLVSSLRIVNVGDQPTAVNIYFKGVLKETSPVLAIGGSTSVNYGGVSSGPLRVESATDGVDLLVTMQMTRKYNGKVVGYSEMNGFPADQLTTEYAFPRYTFNSSLKETLVIANLGSEKTYVNVHLGTSVKGPYELLPGAVKKVKYLSTNKGPVRVISTNSAVNILASLGQLYKQGTAIRSYSELMGYPSYPVDRLTKEYLFPWYTASNELNSQFNVANMGAEETGIQIYIGGKPKENITLLAGESRTFGPYSNVSAGPVRVVSTNTNILASMRVFFKSGLTKKSYSELMGIPYFLGQPINMYLFPWYKNNSALQTELRFGYP